MLLDLRVRNFRCIEAAELVLDGGLNVFTGANGAGKTSFLEAIFFLGRGRSFRASDNRVLIGPASPRAEISGRVSGKAGSAYLGVGVAPGELDVHVEGQGGLRAADLASRFGVQAIDADIHALTSGPPEPRRRLLDWGVFHVEHGYLDAWRIFRRALSQRNAALREQAPDTLLAVWEAHLAAAGTVVDEHRRRYVERLETEFRRLGTQLLGVEPGLGYSPGWNLEQSLATALEASRESDRQLGFTRLGPQRADLRCEIDAQSTRWRASKGQQKLLGAALVLAQLRVAAETEGERATLLVDEPAADLDDERLEAFLGAIMSTPAQVCIASISTRGLSLPAGTSMFHVEHGAAKALL